MSIKPSQVCPLRPSFNCHLHPHTLHISIKPSQVSVHYVLHFNCHISPTSLSITSSILIVTFHPHSLHISIKPSQVCVHYVLHFICHLQPHTLHISFHSWCSAPPPHPLRWACMKTPLSLEHVGFREEILYWWLVYVLINLLNLCEGNVLQRRKFYIFKPKTVLQVIIVPNLHNDC